MKLHTNRRLSLRLIIVTLGCLAAIPTSSVASAAFPSRVIRWIVESPPGSNNDIFARAIGSELAKAWGQPVVVDNRPGALGSIATAAVARSEPDGYTLLSVTNALPLNLAAKKGLQYNAKDFSLVALIFSTTNAFVVNASNPAKSLGDFVADAKKKPQGVSYATPGINSSGHLAGEIFRKRAGFDATHVPYVSSAQIIQELLAERIDLGIFNVAAAMPLVQSGKLRAIGVTNVSRHPAFPDTPTFAEAGQGTLEMVTWFGIAVRADVPEAVRRKLHIEISRILQSQDIRNRISTMGGVSNQLNQAELDRFYETEIVRWRQLIKESGVEFDNQ